MKSSYSSQLLNEEDLNLEKVNKAYSVLGAIRSVALFMVAVLFVNFNSSLEYSVESTRGKYGSRNTITLKLRLTRRLVSFTQSS